MDGVTVTNTTPDRDDKPDERKATGKRGVIDNDRDKD